ncbi:M14 family metallopeptidase [Comamonas sp. lk]|uniref:M14 family metallopeptidase n=1 Tax=Comamonas sp. lk TaxID=2201272 RepID=UPI001F09B41F|nr:M14 family metallopeptidase [Comamonas sp. lk]
MLRLTAVGAVVMLTACANVTLSSWPDPGAKPATASVPASTSAAQPTAGAATAQAVPSSPALRSLPYNPAIEERFPDPAVRYETPGLSSQRQSFTTQAEVSDWLQALASKSQGSGNLLAVITIGTTQRGTPIQALVATHAASTQATALNNSDRPTVLLVGQQHGDEPASAEALLIIARELAPRGLLEPLLQKINVVIVPRANPDGAEAASRLTADGTDLVNDHLLLSTPEARALATLMRDYRPAAVVDLREYQAGGIFLQKYQAVQRYDALLQYANTANTHEFVTKASREWFTQALRSALTQAGLSNEWYYQTSEQMSDKSLSMDSVTPDTLINSSSLKNAAALMVASRGADLGSLHIQRRVHTLVTAATSALRTTAEKAKNLHQVEDFVARDIASQACRKQLVVEAQPMQEQRTINMLQAQSGAEQQVRVNWTSALQLNNSKTRARPCGYWLSASSSQAAERLRLLGVQVMQVAEAGQVLADSYQPVTSTGGSPVLTRGAIEAPVDSFYISLNQAKAHLASAALEPDTPYSYLSKGAILTSSDIARVVATPSVVFEEDAD